MGARWRPAPYFCTCVILRSTLPFAPSAMRELPKQYDHRTAEAHWYARWEEAGCFRSDPDPSRKPYTITIPPPNVTGVLHMGHMLNNTIQDLLVRRKRMLGYNALWVAGTDHASIATEAKVVAMLREQGIRKQDLTREQFLEHAWAWKEKYGGTILKQLRRLGASCDWRRTRFTMDEAYSKQVIQVFVDLYQKGLIYRDVRMVNWDPAGRTALSNEEVIHRETDTQLHYIRYTRVDQPELAITVATTRPETIMADVAIAVHPEDERYHDWVGKQVRIPLLGREIPVITDTYIDREFGTGCLKVTPAHDPNDFEIGRKHGLPVIDILNEDGTLNEAAQLYVGQDRFEVRKQIVRDLAAAGALEKSESIRNSVGYSERTHVPVEPRLSLQWYVKMSELAQPAIKAVLEPEAEGVRLIPGKFEGVYRHWMENIKDWCISRQLWWGHQIPAWYWNLNGETQVSVAETREQAFADARQRGFTGTIDALCQDPDVLDTWFSSWLWPIAVFDGLLDPEGKDYQYYYPTTDLVTAPEILFFWVARMIMAGYNYAGQRPFQNVYLTGIVRDKQRRKMSKSLGNSPDPEELMDRYTTDGVRVGMLLCSPAGNDLLFDEKLCQQGSAFGVKLWNSYRLLTLLEGRTEDRSPYATEAAAVEWLENRIAEVAHSLNQQFDQFRISEALMAVYKLAWDDFCSWYLELLKPAGEGTLSRAAFERTLDLFEQLLILLHPFVPFLTEELWQNLRERKEGEFLMLQQQPEWPQPNPEVLDRMALVQELTVSFRPLRSDNQLNNQAKVALALKDPAHLISETDLLIISKMINLRKEFVTLFDSNSTQQETAKSFQEFWARNFDTSEFRIVQKVIRTTELYLLAEGTGDTAAERAKVLEEIAYQEGFLKSVEVKLSNEKFVANAKPELVERERQKAADAQTRLDALRRHLETLQP